MSLVQTRLRWQKIAQSGRSAQVRISVLASFTANPLVPYLGVALEEAGLSADISIAPFNQIVQECLSPASQTAREHPGVLVVWARLEELWSGKPLPLTDISASYTDEALELAQVCIDAARNWKATLLFVLPAVPEARPLGVGDAANLAGVFATATHVREALRRRLAGEPGVLLLDLEETVRALGSQRACNPRLETLARIPFSEELFSRSGEEMARLVLLSRRPARKVVVVDGDNTLWGGIVGEVGAQGVDLQDNQVGEAFREFQSFLLELRRAGVLLALCSKNDPNDVWEVFARREMRLKREHLAAWRIGWESKAEGLREIAQQLNLGQDSLVLVDDNPAEIAAVQAELGVACILFPADPSEWRRVIQGSGLLDRLPPTADDFKRAEQYEHEQERNRVRARALSPEEYVRQLQVKVRIFEPTTADIPRLAQLVHKTNQFNLNCRRKSEAELASLCADSHYLVRLAHVQDRYGDYGVVGASIVRLDSHSGELDTFVMSCRALGRRVEEAMVADLFEKLDERGIKHLCATVEEHARNEPARRFFAGLGSERPGTYSSLARVEWPSGVERVDSF